MKNKFKKIMQSVQDRATLLREGGGRQSGELRFWVIQFLGSREWLHLASDIQLVEHVPERKTDKERR